MSLTQSLGQQRSLAASSITSSAIASSADGAFGRYPAPHLSKRTKRPETRNLMSQLGQNRQCSDRGEHFRLAPGSGAIADLTEGPSRANSLTHPRQVAVDHSICSSVARRMLKGISIPSIRAVLRLIARLNFVAV